MQHPRPFFSVSSPRNSPKQSTTYQVFKGYTAANFHVYVVTLKRLPSPYSMNAPCWLATEYLHKESRRVPYFLISSVLLKWDQPWSIDKMGLRKWEPVFSYLRLVFAKKKNGAPIPLPLKLPLTFSLPRVPSPFVFVLGRPRFLPTQRLIISNSPHTRRARARMLLFAGASRCVY